jgi:hypothetical protein
MPRYDQSHPSPPTSGGRRRQNHKTCESFKADRYKAAPSTSLPIQITQDHGRPGRAQSKAWT